MRVSCRTSFSHATLSGIDSGHVFVPRANYCRLIFKLGCISDLSPKEVIQSHFLNTPECKSGASDAPRVLEFEAKLGPRLRRRPGQLFGWVERCSALAV